MSEEEYCWKKTVKYMTTDEKACAFKDLLEIVMNDDGSEPLWNIIE